MEKVNACNRVNVGSIRILGDLVTLKLLQVLLIETRLKISI